jgi:hypothetical protein
MYRKDVFRKYNVKVPTTLDELEAAAKALNGKAMTDDGQPGFGIVARGKRAAATSQFAAYLHAEGGDVALPEPRADVQQRGRDPRLELYGRLLRQYGPPGSEKQPLVRGLVDLLAGKAAMYTDANSLFPVIEDAQKSKVVGKVGYALFPRGPKGQYGSTVAAWGLAMPKNSKNQKAAWLFMQWATAESRCSPSRARRACSARASRCGRTPKGITKVPADLRESLTVGSKVGTTAVESAGRRRRGVPRRDRSRHRDRDPGRRRQGRREQGGQRREAHHGRDREEVGRHRLPPLRRRVGRDSVERHPAPVFTFPAVVVVFVLMVFPVLYTLYMSVHSWFASQRDRARMGGLGTFRRAFVDDDRVQATRSG